jgi:hypothetical protein
MTTPTRDEIVTLLANMECWVALTLKNRGEHGMAECVKFGAAELRRVHSQPGGALAEPPAVIWNGKTGLFERPASAPPEPPEATATEPAGGEATAAAGRPFQSRVDDWMQACFGPEISSDKTERNHRFVEEALELAQSCGCTASEAHQLVDYVFGRPVGEPSQEVGGVMVTLAAFCLAHGMSMEQAGKVELARVWTKVEAIRAKQVAKPKHSPLPGPTTAPSAATRPSLAAQAEAVKHAADGGYESQTVAEMEAEAAALLAAHNSLLAVPGLVAALEAILECVTEDGRTKERTRQAALRDMRQFADAALRRLAGEREGE